MSKPTMTREKYLAAIKLLPADWYQRQHVESLAADLERAEAERDALRKDAERWGALCNLWLMCTILTLTQDDDGRWSIEATEPVDSETFATLTGDDPDSAIDAARKEGEG